MSSPDLVSELELAPEMFGEPEALVQPGHALRLAPLRYRRLVWLHRAVTPRQRGPYVLRRRRRWERHPEESTWRRVRAHIRRRSRRRLLREEVMRRARTVEREERRFLPVLLACRVLALAIGGARSRFGAIPGWNSAIAGRNRIFLGRFKIGFRRGRAGARGRFGVAETHSIASQIERVGISNPIRQSIAILMDNGFEILRELKKLRVLYTTQVCLRVTEMQTMVGERDP